MVTMQVCSLGHLVGTTTPSKVAAIYPSAPMKPDPDKVTCWPALPTPGESASSTSPEVAFEVGVEDVVVVGSVVDELEAAGADVLVGLGGGGVPWRITFGEWMLSASARPPAV